MIMRPRGLVPLLLAAFFTASLLQAPAAEARAPDHDEHATAVRTAPAVDLDFFVDSLAPYGQWIDLPQWGWAWYPDGVPAGWQPYSMGHWVYTDWGWTWVSDWDWGWAPFHYGRWIDNDDYGWLWLPGFDWGPAWVAWDTGNDWVGWAPLPPDVRWDRDHGLEASDRALDRRIPDRDFVFVHPRDLTDPHLHDDIAPRARNVSIAPLTRDVTQYSHVDGVPVDRSVSPERIAQAVGHPLTPEPVQEVGSVQRLEQERNRHEGVVPVFRPRIDHRVSLEPPSRQVLSPETPRGRAEMENMQKRHHAEEQALTREHTQELQRMDELHLRQLEARHRPSAAPSNAHARSAPRGEPMMRTHERGAESAAAAAQLERQQTREMEFLRVQHERELHQMQNRHQYEIQRRFQQLRPEREQPMNEQRMQRERPEQRPRR